ncbi:MAG TPA: transglutaminaseTgpA domain-containing protein [Actinomycetota bacterium]|jgi:transglutaminase-like putative cysteine protease
MARTQGSPARTQRLTALVAALLLAAATAFAFARVFEDHASTYRILVAGLVSALIACALERRNLVLATATSAVALVWAIAILVFPETLWHGLPSLDTLKAIADGATLVGEQARNQVAPTPPTDPLLLACVTGIWAAVFSAHALAFRAGSPLLALVPPLALIAFADSVLEDVIRPLYGVAFLIGALAVIFADGLRRVQGWGPVWTGPGKAARLLPSAGRGARRVAAAAVGLALVSPLLIPGFGSQAILDFSTSSDRVRIDPNVSVRARLTAGDDIDLFTVESSAPSYWRMVALPNFDGSKFSPDTTAETQGLSGYAELAGASGADPAVLGQTAPINQTFTALTDLGDLYLPMAYPPTELSIDRDVAWAPDTGTANLEVPLDEGDTYTVTSYLVQPTAEELRADDPLGTAQDPRYLALPSDTRAELSPLAQEWTAGKVTSYDKVIAILDHLDGGDYSYSVNVPASMSLMQFLTETKTGFCQQFATAMAAMLRSLGIPARVAVGFTRGDYDEGSGLYTVSSHDAHTWVEVRFPTHGWIPFEPTPGPRNPAAASYQPHVSTPGESGCRGPECGTVQPPPPRGGSQQQVFDDPVSVGALPSIPTVTVPAPSPWTPQRLLWIAVGLAVLALLSVPPFRAWRRRRRIRRARHDPRQLILATYDVFTQRAGELGFVRNRGETLDEYRARVAASGRLRDGHLDRLTRVASGAAYSPRAPGDEDARAASEDASQALKELRKGTSLSQRVTGAYRRV